VRKLADLWRLRERSMNAEMSREPRRDSLAFFTNLFTDKGDSGSVRSGFGESSTKPETLEPWWHSVDDWQDQVASDLAARADLDAVKWGRATMNRERMLLLLDIAADDARIGPMSYPPDSSTCEREWEESWIGFAQPEWIDTLLDILVEEKWDVEKPDPTFFLFFWSVAERFPEAALEKLQPLHSHPELGVVRAAKELTEGIEQEQAWQAQKQQDEQMHKSDAPAE